ncbi:MAG: hypothetical protein FD174_1657 [Geobacteraceae bacterium]|nr:MAG: hypothetical protein FD174_1657 [Geobacteraceae bacterium]
MNKHLALLLLGMLLAIAANGRYSPVLASAVPNNMSPVDAGRNIVLNLFVGQVEKIKGWQDKSTGRFTVDGAPYNPAFASLMYPLAVAWKVNDKGTSQYRKDLLERIDTAVQAVLPDIGSDGRSDLVGTDGKVWQRHYDPWLYLHMIRTYSIVKGRINHDVEQKWLEALETGFNAIASKELILAKPYNLQLVQAVALSMAAKTLHKPQWEHVSSNFIRTVISNQSEDGFWSEHNGPLVDYNFIYMNALGIYYAETSDESARAALEKGAHYLYKMRYLDGSNVETVDERNYYRKDIREGNIGFAFSDIGASYINEQYETKKYIWYYTTADLLNYRQLVNSRLLAEKPRRKQSSFVSSDNKSAVRYDGSWQCSVSAYVATQSASRWISDRQNFISIFHKKTGLIVGGGNTKLQPLWSTFTVGDTVLMKYVNSADPNFIAPRGLVHVPDSAELLLKDDFGVRLGYGAEECAVRTRINDDRTMTLEYDRLAASSAQVKAHVTIIPHPGKTLVGENGKRAVLTGAPLLWKGGTFGGYVDHDGVRFHVPSSAHVYWPVFPYDQYKKDGKADLQDARIVIEMPFDRGMERHYVRLEILYGREGAPWQ